MTMTLLLRYYYFVLFLKIKRFDARSRVLGPINIFIFKLDQDLHNKKRTTRIESANSIDFGLNS
jgi:hypothetical protein